MELGCEVSGIDMTTGGRAAKGITLKDGRKVRAHKAVVSNASAWDTIKRLIPGDVVVGRCASLTPA